MRSLRNFRFNFQKADMSPRSRRVFFRARFALERSARQKEGVGNAGRPMHPQPRVQKRVESTRASSPQVYRKHPTFPHAMVLTVYFVLSPVIGLFCHRRPTDMAGPRPVGPTSPPQDLTPASRCQDHTTSPSARSSTSSARRLASIASRPASVTIARAPLMWDGTRWIYN